MKKEYPTLIDYSLDFEATREFFGRGSCNYNIGEKKLNSGETMVYLNQQFEGDKIIDTPIGPQRVCEQGLVICGYKVKPTGIFRMFKSPKVEIIPEREREKVESELIGIIDKDKKIKRINFWS